MTGKRTEAFDAIVLGAGAAGLMTALTAGQRGKRILVLEHNDEPGRKILISGGGRCNFTNIHVEARRFISSNPHFARSALARFTPASFLDMIAKHHIAWHEKTLGQLFCDGSARAILAMLLDECAAGDVTLRLSETIQDVRHNGRFTVKTDNGTFEAPALVLACGGLSIPKLGATGLAHRLAGQFGLPVVPLHPGLVPLRVQPDALEWMRDLAGVSLPVRVACGKVAFEEAMLFTHRGLSGPAILQISSYWRSGQPLLVDLLPGQDAFSSLRTARSSRSRAHGIAVLSDWLPRRLAELLGPKLLGEKAAGEWPDKLLRGAGAALKTWTITPEGSEGYVKAEVTTGGIDTHALSSRSMEATGVPGLYAVGEAVDVTGWLGGYNFQWAWASGHAAGEAIAR
ncbi:BaiN/RdsA family NAD(P)/FAD-dependent oxidoreductase [Acetobacter fallax]|uniref:Aminoacetone oxidase family FAD-binding enzyme n=1 Tax=Acetobacter fallax TaxID=1737473 RepID=A0ABX0KEU1_9PROT|nr:NAD(P)/FAD-dependent oxidoreductase [Acetobacter fallax]NHO34004.1 aminoacetone oxidase family FAD-binding enzyme [Acetobacter fallax]NHO37538.1 aminoacetone oxidase family FAD-binding enzyme [Acetobacter fallax]